MPSLKELKTQIENANALGVANLTEKGVELPENATTYEIMSKIAEISGEDNTLTDYEQTLYDFYGVSNTEYPYVVIEWTTGTTANRVWWRPLIYFSKSYKENGKSLVVNGGYKKGQGANFYDDELPVEEQSPHNKSGATIVNKTTEKIASLTTTNASGGVQLNCNEGDYYVTNIPLTSTEYLATMLSIAEANKTELDVLEELIDNSGVLEDTEGTVTEKVAELIDELGVFRNIISANSMFYGAQKFPVKAVVNLPNAINIFQTFAEWNSGNIPIVEELTVNAPGIRVNNSQNCMGRMFVNNHGVKKVILNVPNESQYMQSTFDNAISLEEIVLNFSTKNIKSYNKTFNACRSLKKIIGVIDFSFATDTTAMFANCGKLEEVTFAPNTLSLSISLGNSSKLSANSVHSIIDGLATVTTAQTLTLNKAIVLTDEQKATINAKGWTLAQ